MSMENEPIIPVQVKYVEAQCATILRNKKIPISSPRRIQKPTQQKCQEPLLQNGLCQSPISPEDINVSHGSPVMSPGAGSPTNPLIPAKFQFDPNLTYAEKVAHEMIVTEKIYLDNLKQIIDGFLGPVSNDPDLDVSQENVADLFINVEEIYQFNWVLLQDMEKCNHDPVKLAECFVIKQIGFDVYTKYCTHYPRSMEVLLEWNQREDTANFIKKQQEALGHTLPLCSFLLKPVQRILKYHLLLGNIAKHFKQSEDEEGYEIIQKALSAMTNVAKHINDMKRKHEDAVHLQEIQSVLLDYEGPNLTSFGCLVLEDTFRLHGTKTGRYLFLFEKALLITKRRSDGTFSWKATVMYSNMMLADSVFREPLTFQVIPFDDRKICYTFVSRDLDTKHVWLLELKKRLLDSYAAAVPMKAKQIILGNGGEDCEKENAEPELVRRSISSNTRKGANQQRVQLNKENSVQSAKLSKNTDFDRRKNKDADETLEEKTKTPIDSFKSPLRRKLRVFKKRKFSKDASKSSKRVSWSSDDNNDESYTGKKRLAIKKPSENQKTKVSDSEAYDTQVVVNQNIGENKFLDNNDNLVSISSLLRDGKTMVSVTGEEDNHLSGQVKLRGAPDDILPIKKRRLTREKRQKCKSMPAGQFPTINEEEGTVTRTHSTSRLYEKFLEGEVIDTPTSIKGLQKYGLVNLKENTAKTKRLGSYDEELASAEGIIHRSADVEDDVIKKTGQSVNQTMKRVSAAFSDISPNFSPQKSPVSSTEELTNGDMTAEDLTAGDLTTEDFTPGDLTPEEYTAGDLTPDEFTAGDFSPEECVPGSPIPDEVFDGELPHVVEIQNGEGDDDRISDEGEKENTGEDVDSRTEYRDYKEDGLNTDWNQNGPADDNTYNEDDIYGEQNDENGHRYNAFQSEPSSYADTLSDSFDEQDDESWSSSFDGTYQRVFTLKRSYSEENLVSKFPFDETAATDPSGVSSKSYTHFEHPPVLRSRSADCSTKPQNLIQPFSFSVTPKKKIVIKDSLWETIKEDAEVNHHEIFLAKDAHALRRRRKRKSGHKKARKNKTHSNEVRAENVQHIVRTFASLNMADYRQAINDGHIEPSSTNQNEAEPLGTNTKDQYEDTSVSGKTDKTSNTCDSVTSHSQEKAGKTGDTVVPQSSDKTGDSDDPPVTKIAVALRKKSPKESREKSLVRVDGNVSDVPSTINYLCIEAFPSDESPNTDEQSESNTRDVKPTNENARSRVGRLSKYFDKVTTEKESDSGRYSKQSDTLRKGGSIKKRVEELSKREMDSKNSVKNPEEKLTFKDELYSLQNIHDRIGVLRRSTSEDNQHTKAKIELTSSLNLDIPTVTQLKNRIEEHSTVESGQSEIVKNENGFSKRVSTSLRIRDRIEELRQNPAIAGRNGDQQADKNVDEDLRSCKRLKERIERLQKGAKREVDRGRDITISDDNDTSSCLSSPRQNEELRTVVIKRGWVQQFIQKIETSS